MLNASTDVHATVKKVEASAVFQEFNATNPHHYLVHAFATTTSVAAPLELGYYGKETDMITVFKGDPVTAMPPEEVFKQGGILAPLDLAAVRLGLPEALVRAEKERAAAYPRHPFMKAICVLQQQEGPVWNITLVTGTLQMITMRFSATTGMLVSREMRSIMDLARD
jgi:hypothetical protein